MFLLNLLMMSSAVLASDDHVFYSSYCAAILERQADRQTFDREEVNAALDAVARKAQSYFTSSDEPDTDETSLDFIHFNQRDAGMPNATARNMLDIYFLNAIPRRIDQIHHHLNSIIDGVVARAVVIAGRDDIQRYFDQLDAALERNNQAINQNLEQIFPYRASGRIIRNAVLFGVPTATYGALAAWAGPAMLNLDPTVAQIAATAVTLPLSLMYWPSMAYFKGLLSARARMTYEDTYGVRSRRSRGSKVKALHALLKHRDNYTNALVYLTEEFILSEAEMLELKAAAAASRVPNHDFVRGQERRVFGLPTDRSDEPTLYRLKIDQIMYYDHARGDFVLVVVDRFLREQEYPDRPKRREGTERGARGWGDLVPNGV